MTNRNNADDHQQLNNSFEAKEGNSIASISGMFFHAERNLTEAIAEDSVSR